MFVSFRVDRDQVFGAHGTVHRADGEIFADDLLALRV
jgi:hypothetical protein